MVEHVDLGDQAVETAVADHRIGRHACQPLFQKGPREGTVRVRHEKSDLRRSLAESEREEDYRLVRTTEDLVALRDGLERSGGFACDTWNACGCFAAPDVATAAATAAASRSAFIPNSSA